MKSPWIPNYHGAWAMVTVPPILGIILGHFSPLHLLLLAFWWVGYFAFFATGQWLRSRRKQKYLKPVIVYWAIVTPLGLANAILEPYLIWWAIPFAPLVLTTLWESHNRRDRGLLNDTVTVVAACLMIPVAYQLGVVDAAVAMPGPIGWHGLIAVTLSTFAYYWGTVLYVKTNIRERKSRGYFWASVLYHAACALAVIVVSVLATIGAFDFFATWIGHAVIWTLTAIRAAAVPMIGKKRRIRPTAIGVGEIITAAAMTVTILF